MNEPIYNMGLRPDEIPCELAKDIPNGIVTWKEGQRVYARPAHYGKLTYSIRPAGIHHGRRSRAVSETAYIRVGHGDRGEGASERHRATATPD